MMGGLITYALTCGGGDDAELHDKEVELSTSDITGSQTAIFVYNPQNEQPDPWDGYSLFTIDLSGVKEDIEELQQQLQDCHDCWEDVVEALQQYDPNYDPQEGECPADEVPVVYQIGVNVGIASVTLDAKTITQNGTYPASAESPPLDGFSSVTVTVSPNTGSKFITQNGTYLASSDSLDGYDTVVVDVQDCGYTFPKDETGEVDYDKITDIIGNDTLTDNDLHIVVKAVDDREPPIPAGKHNVYYGFYDSVTGAFIDRTQAFQSTIDPEHTDYVSNFHITDPSTGTYTFDWVTWEYLYNPPIWDWVHHTYTGTSRNLIGYGDPTHSYTVSKNS